MAFTTRDGLRQLWRLADIDAAVVARVLEVSPDEAEQRLAEVKARGSDREAHARLFGELSVPALVVLALLVDSDGVLDDDTLRTAADIRFGLGEHEVSVGVLQAARALLAVTLRSATQKLVALVDAAAPAVAHLVRDLDLPRVPAGATVEPAPDHDGGRALLAACLALGQFEVKATQAGVPHRGATRRLAKQLGADEDQLERWLLLGISLGLVRSDDDNVLRPVLPAVAAAARGEFPHHPIVDAFVRRLREAGGPVPVAQVASWMTDAVERGPYTRETPERLAQLPGVRAGKVGDIAVLEAVAPVPAGGQAAASLTPSFEVFLPPESRLDHVVDVLGTAELVRIDRVLVARITRASIQRALAGLDSADRIIAALAAASRTPVPQNVAAAIRDWADGTIRATVAVGRVIVVPAAEHERVLRVLAAVDPVALAPGVVVVGAEVPARTVSAMLAKAGIDERRAIGDAEANARDADQALDAERTRDRLTDLRPLVAGDPALRDRLAAYRAGDRAERARVAPCVRAHAHAVEDERGGDGRGLAISPAAVDRVERWERQHGALDDEDASMLAALLDVAAPPDQAYLLAASKPEILRSRISEVLIQRGGFDAFMTRHRRLIERIVPRELLARIEDSTASPPPPATVRDWDRVNVVSRVAAAERTQSALVLDLGKGQIQTVKILRLLPRGRELMLLGEDVDDQSRVAVSLASVFGVAEPPRSLSPAPAPRPATDTRVWRPVGGQSPPAGHAPCPCGSGLRYRACCRPALPANRPS